jgi:hypothetical protein
MSVAQNKATFNSSLWRRLCRLMLQPGLVLVLVLVLMLASLWQPEAFLMLLLRVRVRLMQRLVFRLMLQPWMVLALVLALILAMMLAMMLASIWQQEAMLQLRLMLMLCRGGTLVLPLCLHARLVNVVRSLDVRQRLHRCFPAPAQ